MKADAAARFRDAHDRIDLAWLVTGQAELAVLDAITARAWADERAASSPAN